MSEYRLNQRRNWKAETFPYDDFIPDETKECLYCLTEKQAEILRGIIEPLGWETRWWSDTTGISKQAITEFRDDIIRRLIMPCGCEDTPVQFRYTVDGILQKSTDGGTTWVDSPENDVRLNSPEFPPPVPVMGVDLKCQAADSAVKLIKEQVGDQLTDDMSRFTLNQLITTWVTTLIETSNPFIALLTVVSNQIFALVIAAIRPALTNAVYQKLQCILFENMEDDASFTVADWDTLRGQILSDITGIAGIFLEHLFYLLGAGGSTNLVRTGAGDSTAANCCPECNIDNWHIVIYNGAPVGQEITRDATSITVKGLAHGDFGGPWHAMIQTTGDSICCSVRSIELLSGDSVGLANFHVECGFPRWPGSSNGNLVPPETGGSASNGVYIRQATGGQSQFTVKINFF